MMQEVLEKLSPAEVDVDRAEEATEMLKQEQEASGVSKARGSVRASFSCEELMLQAQQAVTKALFLCLWMLLRGWRACELCGAIHRGEEGACSRLGLERLVKALSLGIWRVEGQLSRV